LRVKVDVVAAQAEHIPYIAAHMRQADQDEIWAARRLTPERALKMSLGLSTHAWTGFVNGTPAVMFGVGAISIMGGIGAPWLLGTDAVERHFVSFLRGSRIWLSAIQNAYPVLQNIVDDRNTVSKRWLQWLGFTMRDPIQVGTGVFRPFDLRKTDV